MPLYALFVFQFQLLLGMPSPPCFVLDASRRLHGAAPRWAFPALIFPYPLADFNIS